MQKNLVIVESPAKAKTIEKFLGKDFKVLSSYGHIRDLKKKEFSIDVDKDFKPHYEIPADKKKIPAPFGKIHPFPVTLTSTWSMPSKPDVSWTVS